MKIRGPHWCQILNACLALAVSSLLVAILQSVVSADEPPRRQIIFLFDNSRSMYIGTDEGSGDPNGQAHKMARLLIRYLQLMTVDGSYEVGAANFSNSTDDYESDYRVLMPLKPVDAWSENDIGQVQALSCPGSDDPTKGVKGKDPCLGTYRSSAIGWAAGQLASCPETNDRSSCLIVMFTDDQTIESHSETQDNIKQTLQRLPTNIDFYVVAFPEEDASDTIWHEWSNEHRLAGRKPLVETPVINTDLGSITNTYRQLIEMLAISGTSARDIILDLPSAKQSLSRWYAPNVNFVEMDLISSTSVLSETYATTPDIRAGSKRIWYLPRFMELTAAFEVDPVVTSEDIAVLRIVTHTVPIETEVMLWPDHPLPSQPIAVRALVHAGPKMLEDTAHLTLAAQLQPENLQIDMRPDPASGLWAGTIPPLIRSGDYELEVQVRPRGWSPNDINQVTKRVVRLRDSQWKIDLLVDPPVGLEGQLRQFEVVARLNDQFVKLPPGTTVMTMFPETGEKIDLRDEYGTWRAKHPIERTQDVVAVVQLGGREVITSVARAIVTEPPLARIEMMETSRFLGLPFPVPGEPISVTVSVSSSQAISPVLYVHHGRGRKEVLSTRMVASQRYEGKIARPWGLTEFWISSDNVQLLGETTIKGEMLVLAIVVSALVVLFSAFALLRKKTNERFQTHEALNMTIRGDPDVLTELIRTHTVHDDKVRTELSRVLARHIAKQNGEL